MYPTNVVKIFVITGLLFLCTAPAFGQAIFGVATTQPPVADIGVTELTGEVALTVLSGTTVEAPLAITYSAPITNNSAAEIKLLGTLGLAGINRAPTLNSSRDTITIVVPAGGLEGSKIYVRGVRVDVAGRGTSQVTATVKSVTTGGNAISAGQETGPVIGQVTPPFTIDLTGSDPLSFQNGKVVIPDSSFMLQEGNATSFTDNVGLYGQTVPTRIRITPFPEIPKGVKVTLGVVAGSTEAGSSFRTLSGQPETVPRADGSTSVIYEFTSAPGSEWTVESFKFYTSIAVESTATASGTITFQAAILPIGTAVPDSEFPSTDIPRYLERDVPDETDLITGSSELAFPFVSSQAGVYTGIAITNPLNYRVDVTLTAYDANGAVITGKGIKNPVELTMPRRGQIAQLATELFGSGLDASTLGTIRAVGKTPVLVGFYLVGAEQGTQLDGATAEVHPIYSWIWPNVFHNAPSPANYYELFNPRTSAAKAQLELFDSSGRSIAKGSQTVRAGGTVLLALEAVFTGIDLSAFEGGYVKGTSNVPLVVHQTFGNVLELNVLAGQVPIQKQTYYFAHFASGGGYDSEINFVNSDQFFTADIRLTVVDEDGGAFEIGGNPAAISIQPGRQWTQKVADLFPGLGVSLTTGYIKVEVKPYLIGAYPTVPVLTGSVRFSSAGGYGSAALPLFIAPASEFIFSHVAQAQGWFTGVAMMNPNQTAADFTLDVFRQDGALVGSRTGSLKPGEKISRLLYQLIPATARQIGGYIRVRADIPLVSFSLFGTDDGLSLSAIPPQESTSELQQ
jgi:hypothetical protein